MLSLNSISISSSDSKVLDEIYDILNAESLESDISKYHFHTEDSTKFLSLFFDGTQPKYEDFGIEWAYIESCEKSDIILANIYSYNGNLSFWTAEIIKKYKVDITIEMTKSIRFKNYDIEQNWTETKMPDPEPILGKKSSK